MYCVLFLEGITRPDDAPLAAVAASLFTDGMHDSTVYEQTKHMDGDASCTAHHIGRSCNESYSCGGVFSEMPAIELSTGSVHTRTWAVWRCD
jgi:hypothetical protein